MFVREAEAESKNFGESEKTEQKRQDQRRDKKCFKCGKPGHFKRGCPLWEKEVTSLVALDEEQGGQGLPPVRPHQEPLINIKVGPKEDTAFLVDTGVAHSSLTFQPQNTKLQPEKLLVSGVKGEGFQITIFEKMNQIRK